MLPVWVLLPEGPEVWDVLPPTVTTPGPPEVLAAPVSPGPAAHAVTGAMADNTAARPAAAALRRTDVLPQEAVLQCILCFIGSSLFSARSVGPSRLQALGGSSSAAACGAGRRLTGR